MKRNLWRLPAVLLSGVLLITSGCSFLPEEEENLAPPLIEPKAVSYETVTVEKGHIERLLKGTATLKSYDETSYFFEKRDSVFKAVYVSVGQQVDAGTLLAEVDSGDLDNQLKQMEITKKKQQLELANLKARYAEATEAGARRDLKLQIDLMNLDIESTDLSYSQLKSEKASTQLVAKSAGIVAFASGAFQPGDPVPAYQTLVTVADPSKLQLFYESSSAKEAQKGMSVTYSYKGTELTGEVLQSPKDVPADADELYKNALLMSCDNIPAELSWGNQMDFSIVLAESDDALIVPRSALTEYSDKYYVDVLDGENKYNVEVSLGIIGATDVQVVGGLEEGMEVIVG